jgi:hypothetical protein
VGSKTAYAALKRAASWQFKSGAIRAMLSLDTIRFRSLDTVAIGANDPALVCQRLRSNHSSP